MTEPTPSETAAPARKRIHLNERHARPAWAGHPNVYDGAIAKTEGEPQTGDEVDVVDAKERFVGRGVFHAEAPVRVRIYRWTEGPIDDAFVGRRIAEAVALRRDVLRLPGRATCWRIVHGDGDRFAGLVADRYGDFAVVQVTTRAAADRRAAIAASLMSHCGVRGVWERASTSFAESEGFHPGGGRLAGDVPPDTVDVTEDGISWRVDLKGGPKTGHFLDQRDNRASFAPLCGGRTVLDVFAGTGGFGIAAMKLGGAASVLAVDSSQGSSERLRENAAANGCADAVTVRVGDAFEILRDLERTNARFGAVSLDPPRFAASRRELSGAARGYRELNLRVMRLLEPGGVLATSSCTGVLTDEEFETIVRDAAVDARRRVQVIRRGGQGGDHPWLTAVPESRYLKHLVARVL
ncbi:MAG: Ribosomal RNA large subunit methyltransferase I [Planctomycetes bacterium]|nr:Ribosomal RNA large subunit methyltransferase I [Planctomycetota bacterium]